MSTLTIRDVSTIEVDADIRRRQYYWYGRWQKETSVLLKWMLTLTDVSTIDVDVSTIYVDADNKIRQ